MDRDGNKILLLVEDQAMISLVEAKLLQKYGYRVVTAYNGEKAVEIVRDNPDIDLVLMDIDLGPGQMDGTRAAQLILQQRDLPLIFLSGHTEREVVEKTEGITSYGYIVKDSGETVLLASIKMAFRLFEAQTKEKEKDEALRDSEERFRSLVEEMPGVVYIFSRQRGGLYYSPYVEQLLGYPVEHLYAHPRLWSESIHPEDQAAVHDAIFQFEQGKPFAIRYRIRNARGEWCWLADRSIRRRIEQDEIVIEGLATDISPWKQADEQAQTLLQEKGILLKEVHHQIKNNMSTISGLLQLQISTQEDPAVQNALRDAKSRAQSMMVLYDKLYCSDDFGALSLRDYLPPLLEQIISIFPNASDIELETELEEIVLGHRYLYPLGIILNELTTNAMKHAFSGRSQGKITVTVAHEGPAVRIDFADDGLGIPETFTLEDPSGFGMQIVGLLVEQIGGTIAIDRQNGTKFTIRFTPK